jgi:F-type H+-transporting ATPase subunit alpha
MPVEYQVIIIYAATRKHLLDIPVADVLAFEKDLFKYPEIPAAIRDTRVLSEDTEALLVKAIKECKEQR